ncbi:MAG: TonB family protein [Longimicrobiales bacterium]
MNRPGGRAVVGSVLLHASLVAAMLFAGLGAGEIPPVVAYRVSIVSPPPQAAGEPAPAVAEADAEPEPEPEAEPEPPPPAPPEEEAPPRPAEEEPSPAPDPEPAEESSAPEEAEPAPTRGNRPDPSSEGGEDLDVNIEGEAFPYPDYLENIIRQVRRYFRWTGAPNLRAEVYFVIHRDGSVSDIRILRSSGNRQFDFQALGAIEVAGNRLAFGALPEGFQRDQLPVSFFIDAQ